MVYVQVFVGNPDFLGFTDLTLTEASAFGGDINNNGHQNDPLGGYLINPAHITITYEDEGGNEVASPAVLTGDGLSTYLSIDNPDNDLGLYYRTGDTPIV